MCSSPFPGSMVVQCKMALVDKTMTEKCCLPSVICILSEELSEILCVYVFVSFHFLFPFFGLKFFVTLSSSIFLSNLCTLFGEILTLCRSLRPSMLIMLFSFQKLYTRLATSTDNRVLRPENGASTFAYLR